MEGHHTQFERQADDQHGQGEHGQGRIGLPGRNHLLDASKVGVPGRAVEQRASKEQNRCSKRAEQKVFHRAFNRPRAGPAVGDEGVSSERHRLEPQEDAQQVDCARKHHRTECREDDEHVELAALEVMLAKVPAGQQRGEAGSDANDDVEEQTKPVDCEVAGDDVGSGRELTHQHGPRDPSHHEEGSGGDHGELGALVPECIDQHDGEPRRDEQQ